MIWVVTGCVFITLLLVALATAAGWQVLVLLAGIGLFILGMYSIVRALEYLSNK